MYLDASANQTKETRGICIHATNVNERKQPMLNFS